MKNVKRATSRLASIETFPQCEDYSEQSKPFFEPLTFAELRSLLKLGYFDFVCLRFQLSSFDFVCLHFHYNEFEEANSPLTILETRLRVFA